MQYPSLIRALPRNCGHVPEVAFVRKSILVSSGHVIEDELCGERSVRERPFYIQDDVAISLYKITVPIYGR